jgi:hypothetical protein
MFPDQRVRDVPSEPVIHSLRGAAAGIVKGRAGRSRTQKANSPQVADSDEKIGIQCQRFVARNHSTAAAKLVAQFDLIFGATEDIRQLGASEKHDSIETPVLGLSPMTPGGEGSR